MLAKNSSKIMYFIIFRKVDPPQSLTNFDFLVWLFDLHTVKDCSIIWVSNPSSMRAQNEGEHYHLIAAYVGDYGAIRQKVSKSTLTWANINNFLFKVQ